MSYLLLDHALLHELFGLTSNDGLDFMDPFVDTCGVHDHERPAEHPKACYTGDDASSAVIIVHARILREFQQPRKQRRRKGTTDVVQ